MKQVPLKRRDGTVVAHARVDDADFTRLMRWTWRLSSKGYAERGENVEGVYRKVLMHCELCPCDGEVDHRDRDRLNNQRANLRPATRVEQMQNRGVFGNNRLGLRGVRSKGEKFQARVQVGGRQRSIGVFDTPELAAAAASAFRREHMGEEAA